MKNQRCRNQAQTKSEWRKKVLHKRPSNKDVATLSGYSHSMRTWIILHTELHPSAESLGANCVCTDSSHFQHSGSRPLTLVFVWITKHQRCWPVTLCLICCSAWVVIRWVCRHRKRATSRSWEIRGPLSRPSHINQANESSSLVSLPHSLIKSSAVL